MADIASMKLEIVTPTGVAISRDVIELTAPSLDGEIGVLPGHVPLLAAVRTGTVSLRAVGSAAADDPLRYAVAHGVLEVTGDKALLLTERFAKKEDVDVVKTRSRLKEVDEELLSFQGELEDEHRTELIDEEVWLASLLELIGDPPAPIMRELTRFIPHEEPVIQDEDAADDETSETPPPPEKKPH